MKYNKIPLTIEQQITKLKQRGLLFNDEIRAKNYLSNISYYRLRAYTFPFQDNIIPTNDHHFFTDNISFEDIVDLYCFDRRLRLLILNALEKIEIALRTKFTYEYCIETNDSHWFTEKSLYFNQDKYDTTMGKITDDVNRSLEDFIKHYQTKYTYPDLPPSWMTLETLSFGNLSKLISNLDCKSDPFKRISIAFGLPKPFILENWIYSFSVLRNFCAHHSRIWNRRFHVEMKLPYNTTFPFIGKESLTTIRTNKLFAILSCIQYIIKIISPESSYKNTLIRNISDGGKLLNIKDMGFPHNWKEFEVWK
jgi:abortive infection bacteriophage resistance protein